MAAKLNLRKIKDAHNLTVEQFADKLGISRTAMFRKLAGGTLKKREIEVLERMKP